MSESKTIHTMSFPELPYYLTVKQIIDRDDNAREGGTVNVVVESRIHVNREITMPTSFTVGYVESRPNGFRADVLDWIIRAYGLKLEPIRYV